MRNKDNKRPSAGKGTAGRGRSAGTGKSAFRDSSSPKRGRPAGKSSSVSNSGRSKDTSDSPFSRRNKPFAANKDSSSFAPRERSGGRPSDQGDAFRTSGRGPSKYPRRDNPFSAGKDSAASREHGDRPYKEKDSAGAFDKGPSKYMRRDKPFSSARDTSAPRERSNRPYERRDSSGTEDTGPKKYVRREKPFSSDKDSSAPRERSNRPYERRESSGTEDTGPKKYVRREKPFSSDKDSSAPRERSNRPYERRDSSGTEDSGPKKYVRRDKPFSSDRDTAAPRERSDRPYERRDSSGTEDSGPKKYIHRDKPSSSERDSSATRRDRPLAEPRKPILDLREEKLKAARDWEEESTGSERPERPIREEQVAPKYSRRSESETIRLNKFIANAGICSRREADELIRAGAIKVNGVFVTEMGIRVGPRDKVQYGDQTLAGEKMVYVLLNKPKGYLTTSEDPFDRKTVMELVADACRERIYPVGRLDRNTTGLLLLTNDGDMAKKLTHPRHKVKKIYHVELEKGLTKSDMIRISEGVELDDGVVKADEIAYTGEGKKEVGIELHSGKNRVVRRIFELLEYDVVKLDRVSFAGLTKKDLPRGRWRFLTESEVNYLKMLR
ncbi:MAG: pseudouridine synthase [Bacteroidales bacterium]